MHSERTSIYVVIMITGSGCRKNPPDPFQRGFSFSYGGRPTHDRLRWLMRWRNGNPQFFQFFIKGAAADAKFSGGFRLVPVIVFQGFSDSPFFRFEDGQGRIAFTWPGFQEGCRQITQFDLIPFCQHHRMFDTVFQFADIARPGAVDEPSQNFASKTKDFFILLPGRTDPENSGPADGCLWAAPAAGGYEGESRSIGNTSPPGIFPAAPPEPDSGWWQPESVHRP